MGLFDKIKKAAPTVGATAAAGAAAAAGVYAGQSFAKDKPLENETPDQKPDGATPPTNADNSTSASPNSVNPEAHAPSATVATPPASAEQSASQTQVDESPESIYDSETGTTTYHYANGNTLTEYAGGSRAFYDASTGETTGYDASTGETITRESDGDIRIDSSDGSRVTFETDGDIVEQASDGTTVTATYDPVTGNTIVQNHDGLGNTGVFNSDGELISTTYIGELPDLDSEIGISSSFVGASATASINTATESSPSSTADGLFSRIKEINDNIPNEMKAAGLGVPDQPVQEFRTYQEGSLEEGQVRYGYEGRVGWEASHRTHHSGRDEVAPGIGLNSEATYDAESFVGASSKGEAGAEWNSEEAHLYAQGRTMVGAEANVDASYKGTLDVEGVKYQPGAEAQGHANAFAGAEAEGKGDLSVTSDGARGNLGGGAFAGAKAEVGGSGALSVDGNEFARGKGGVDARAGIGVDANIDAGYQDGQINYGFDAGAAIGVGAGYQYSGSVDAPGIITHPDAVGESAVEEVSSYVPEIPSYSTDLSTYTAQTEQYVVQQVQEYVPIPEEVSQVAEVISDPGSVIEDIGSSFGF